VSETDQNDPVTRLFGVATDVFKRIENLMDRFEDSDGDEGEKRHGSPVTTSETLRREVQSARTKLIRGLNLSEKEAAGLTLPQLVDRVFADWESNSKDWQKTVDAVRRQSPEPFILRVQASAIARLIAGQAWDIVNNENKAIIRQSVVKQLTTLGIKVTE
jgi:hypothetical protein